MGIELENRSLELHVGGRLVLVVFAIDKNGYYLGNTSAVPVNMFGQFNSIWKEFVSDGAITEEDFHRMTFANYYRTEEELKEPFEKGFFGLELRSLEIKTIPCRYRESYERGEYSSATEYAKDYVGTLRTWSNSTFALAIENEVERDRIMHKFWKVYENKVESNPRAHGMDYVMAYMEIERVK